MARRVTRRSQEQILMNQWWVRALIALVLVGLAYGFASLAIDSGNLVEYAVTIILLWLGVRHAYSAVRFAISR
jgi:hypothetical protein